MRFWQQALVTEPHTYDSALVLLCKNFVETGLEFVGNAFVIYRNKGRAICLTAAHNLDYMKRDARRRRVQPHPTTPIDFIPITQEFYDTDECWAVFPSAPDGFTSKIHQLSYIDNYDVAALEIDAPDSLGHFAIDLRMPQVGDEVAILGNRIETNQTDGGLVLSKRLDFLFGTVTKVTLGASRQKQSYCFETTIPIASGMSGAPILINPRAGHQASVCGVASFDVSQSLAFTDFKISGISSVSGLLPLLGLALKVQIEGQNAQYVPFSELWKRRFIGKQQTGLIVCADHCGDSTKIYYEDLRESPPKQLLYEMTKHPYIE